jgi:hypothetical protein
MTSTRLFAASVALCGVTVWSAGATTASAQYYPRNNGRQANLQADRLETMRSLAHFLDEGTQFTLEEATDALADSRNWRDRAFLDSLRRLAARTESFHDRLDNYQANPWDLDADVRLLLTEARRVNSRLRRINAVSNLYDDWAEVVDDVNRMQRLMAGENVQVPTAHAEWDRDANGADHDHSHGGGGMGGAHDQGGYGADQSRFLTGRELQQVRQLAHDLDAQARRALAAAEDSADASGRGLQMLANLRHFVGQTAALHDRTDSDRLDPRDFGAVVSHLIEDARAADTGMRQARVFSDAWDEWQQTIAILRELDTAVRR